MQDNWTSGFNICMVVIIQIQHNKAPTMTKYLNIIHGAYAEYARIFQFP